MTVAADHGISPPPLSEVELRRASMAALASPLAKGFGPLKPFEPFERFSWTEISRGPIGASAREAGEVAWLMTCSPWMSHEESRDAAKALSYACHLRAENDSFTNLYGRVTGTLDRPLHMSEVEAAINGRWSEKNVSCDGCDGPSGRLDPYFFRILQDGVSLSLQKHLQALDSSICTLGNSAPLQNGVVTNRSMKCMVTSLSYHLTQALLNQETTTEQLCNIVLTTSHTYLETHVGHVKQHLREQIARLRALYRVAASPDEKLDFCVQEEETDVINLFVDPPPEFIEQLKYKGVGFTELYDVFCPNANGLLTTQAASCSFAVRMSTLARCLERHKSAISEVVVSTITLLQRVQQIPLHSGEWSSVTLCSSTGASPPDMDYSARWSAPTHLGDSLESFRGMNIVAAKAQCHIGLRSARMASVLLQEVRRGLLPVATFASSLVTPIISRIASEADIGFHKTVNSSLRTVALKHGVDWPEDAQRKRHHPSQLSQLQSDPPAPTTRHRPSTTPTPPTPPSRAPAPTCSDFMKPPTPPTSRELDTCSVPQPLLRDHAILHALCLSLQPLQETLNAKLALDEIVATVRGVAPILQDHSDASLRQAVRWVCVETIKRSNSEAPLSQDSCEFSSVRDRSGNGKIGGVVCYGRGACVLFRFAATAINEMRYNGNAFLKTWRVSRSSKAKAASVVKRARA